MAQNTDPRKRRTSVFLDATQFDGLKALKARDGINEAEAIRRAIDEFLERKGIFGAGRKRAVTRQRP